jgi:hypothetical protein
MQECPLCSGTLVTKTSSAGPEVYCNDCRNVIYSATLGFTAASKSEVQICEKDGLPGFKGPGAKANCWTYQNDEDKIKARKKAEASAHNESRMAHIAALVNTLDRQVIFATPQMDPATAVAGMSGATDAKASLDNEITTPHTEELAMTVAKPPSVQSETRTKVQELDGAGSGSGGPMSSGTISSRRLAELAVELESTAPRVDEIMKNSLGPSFCTSHNTYDSCNE